MDPNMMFQQNFGNGMNFPMMNQQMMNQPMMNQQMMNQSMMNQPMINQQMMNQPMINQPMMNQPMVNQMNPFMMNQQIMNQMMLQQQQPNMMNQANIMNQVLTQSINQQQLQQQSAFPNNQNNFQSTNSNYITVHFRIQQGRNLPTKDHLTIQCNLDDKVSDVIKAYRTKTQDFDEEHDHFIFNAKKLNQTLSCAEAGIVNGSIIYVLNDKDVDGGK